MDTPSRRAAIMLVLFAALIAACAVSPSPPAAPSPTLAIAPTVQAAARPTATVPQTSPSAVQASTVGDWATYHNDNTRTGYVPNMPDPQRLALAWKTALDGAVYAEPLVVDGHVIVATEGDSLYSLNADTGKVEWRTNVGAPVPRSALPCGNIDPLGITGTPVYDSASGLIFAAAEVTGPAHVLVGIDAHTGQVRLNRSADPPGMPPLAHQQRAALALSKGMVYVAYGGLFGDCGNYHGTVVASRTDGTGPLLTYQVPTGREGGIWAAAGPTVDASGDLFVSVGNGSEVVGDWDHSDSVLHLSPSLELKDGFAPDQWRQDNLTDADLGSLAPVMLSDGHIFIAGKSGTGYVLNSQKLGGVGGQLQTQPVCHAYGGAAIVGTAAYIPCNEGVQAIQVGSDGALSLGWRANGVPGSPVVGGRTVYSLDRSGTLHALDIATGSPRATLAIGPTSRFATPTLYKNHVFVGTMTGVAAVTASP